MLTLIELISDGLLLILVLIILVKIWQYRSKSEQVETRELRDKIMQLESTMQTKMESFPDLLNSKVAETMQRRFSDFTESVSEKYQAMIEKFGVFQNELTKSSAEHSKKLTEDLYTFKDQLQKASSESFDKLNQTVEKRLEQISAKVQENLSEGFEKTNKTFQNIIERLAKIDEAQKNIESLSTNVVSLQDILTDKKSRGIFGEVQLNQILVAVFGEKNEKIYRTQYKLSNSNIVDAILFAPEPTGWIPIDSKFPLENYKLMIDRTIPETEHQAAMKRFQNDVKKQIDMIADKYIIPGETSNQAVMFLPAEAVFAELHAYHDSLVNYAHKRRVWITSPSTFMAVLNTLQIVLYDIERRKFADIIQEELVKLSDDFRCYKERWDKLSTHIETVHKDVKEIHTSTQKITRSFHKIARVELDTKKPIASNEETLLLDE